MTSNSVSNARSSGDQAPESMPLMPIDNNRLNDKELSDAAKRLSHVERESQKSSGDVSIDLESSGDEKEPKLKGKKKTIFPPGFDVEQTLTMGKVTEGVRRDSFRKLFATAIRAANIDCAANKFEATDMEITDRAAVQMIEQLRKETKKGCLSLLQWSAVLGLNNLVPLLIELESDVSQMVSKSERTVPMIAAQFGHPQIVLELLGAASSQNELLKKETSELDSLIEIAASVETSGDSIGVDLVKELLVKYETFFRNDPKGLNQCHRALSAAVRTGNFPAVKSLIENGVSINQSDNTGIPPLVLAVQLEQINIVEFLSSIDSCDVNIESATKDTPLMVAARCKSPELLKILLKNSTIDPNKMTSTLIHGPKTALKEAAHMENNEQLELLLESGANVVTTSGNKTCNALLHAIENVKNTSAEILIKEFFNECLSESAINSKFFEDTLLACVLTNNSEILQNILEHNDFYKSLHKFGGLYVLWRCLMFASQKGFKKSVLVLIKYPMTPKVTCRADLTDLAVTTDAQGRTPLHCLASTCLDEEVLECIKPEDGTGINTNWLLIKNETGKTVLEHFSKEENLISFLGLQDEPDTGVRWVDSFPKKPRDIFHHKYSSMERDILKLCVVRFPNVAEAIIKSMVVAGGWGIHDDNLQVAINWQIVNDTLPSGKMFSNNEDEKYSDILRIASEHNPELLQNPVMKLLQRYHWRKMPIYVFRVQFIWAFLLALFTTIGVLEWKSGSFNTPMFSVTLFMGIASLFFHFLHIFGGLRAYMTSFYNYIQFLLYLAIIFAALLAFRQNCQPKYEDCEEIPEIVKKNFREKFCWFSFLILATWQNFFKVIQRSTLLGLYSIMFQNAFISFLGILIPLCLLVFSFGITFYALYATESQTLEVDDFQGFLMKIASMTIGGVESTEMGYDTNSGQYNPRLILAIFFVVMITVITFNLLTGLVINDVNEALSKSKLLLMQLRIEQISETEVIANMVSKIFPKLREHLVFCAPISLLHPNDVKKGKGSFRHKLDKKLNGFMSLATINEEIMDMSKPF